MDRPAELDPADYLSLAARCRTVNQFNRLHVDIENIAAPLELAAIRRKLRRQDRESRAWMRVLRHLDPSILSRPEPYQRRELAPSVLLFGDPSIPAEEKQVMIGFCGLGPRLMISIGFVLQALPASRWDVLFLIRRTGAPRYVEGMGLAPDLAGLMDVLRRLAGLERYRRVVTLGASVGGHPAIEAAVHLGADRVVALGTRPSDAPLPSMEAWTSRPHFAFVYGADHAKDADGARALAAHFGGELFPLPGIDQHSMLFALLRKHELRHSLPVFLGDEPPRRRRALARFLGLRR